jgi:pimeloyl-ACP methyl ester carboxylesterase
MPYVNLDGTRFYHKQLGHGPDVVLLHAVTSNMAVWLFIGIIEALRDDFRVTAYDLRGHGQTDVTPTGYTSLEMAGDLHKLAQALNLGPAFLVGHSFGAVIALHAAVRYPEMVRGLILSDPFFPGLSHIEPNLGDTHVWQEMRATFQRSGADLGEKVDFARLFRTVADMTPAQVEQVRKDMNAPSIGWLAQLPRLAPTTCGEDVFAAAGLTAEAICSVRQPVVALYDEHTPFVATRRYLAEHLPNWTIDTVPGAKHVAPLQSSKAFIELVQKHLRAM